MKWNIGSALIIISISLAIQASEKQQTEEKQQGLKRAREVMPQELLPTRKILLKDFLCFPELLPELQEKVIKEFIYSSLLSCKCYEDYQKLYSSLWTDKRCRVYALRALREISERSEVDYPTLRLNFEILKLYSFYVAKPHEPSADVSFALGILPQMFSNADERIRQQKVSFDQALLANTLSPDQRKEDLDYYIKADRLLADSEQRFLLLKRAENSKQYALLVQLINKCVMYVTQHAQDQLNAVDEDGATLLLWTCAYGCDSATHKLLIMQDIEINKASSRGTTPLIAACRGACATRSGNAESFRVCVKMLLAHRGKIQVNGMIRHINGEQTNFSALMYAALSGDVELVQPLLEAPGIEVNAKDAWGWTALMAAIQNNHLAIVQRLLQCDCIDTDGTVLAAARFNRLEIMKILRTIQGIKVNVRLSSDRRTALLEAVDRDQDDWFADRDKLLDFCARYDLKAFNLECLRFLLSFPGIDFTLRGRYECTPLLLAVACDNVEAVREILKHGGDITINVQDREGFAPLVYAAAQNLENKYTLVQLLLSVPGVDVNLSWDEGTALLMAVKNEDTCMVKLLLTAPTIDINFDHDHRHPYTALMAACEVGNKEIVEILLARDEIDVHVGSDHENAFSLAFKNGYHEICGLLRARGARMPGDQEDYEDSESSAGSDEQESDADESGDRVH